MWPKRSRRLGSFTHDCRRAGRCPPSRPPHPPPLKSSVHKQHRYHGIGSETAFHPGYSTETHTTQTHSGNDTLHLNTERKNILGVTLSGGKQSYWSSCWSSCWSSRLLSSGVLFILEKSTEISNKLKKTKVYPGISEVWFRPRSHCR